MTALGDAHVPVNEVLNFNACAFFKKTQLIQRHFPVGNHAGEAVSLQLPHGMLVMGIHHDRGVQGNRKTGFLGQLQNGEVLYNQGVRLQFLQ